MQGAFYKDLRIECAKEMSQLDLPGFGIGGLSVGEPKEIMYDMLDEMMPYMPQNKPRYLMGVGSPDCLIEGVLRGVDMFDCVLATRVARNGTVFTHDGRLVVRNAKYAEDFTPLDRGLRLLCLQELHPRLHSPSVQGGRNTGAAAELHPQHLFPDAHDDGNARGHRKRRAAGLDERILCAPRARQLVNAAEMRKFT